MPNVSFPLTGDAAKAVQQYLHIRSTQPEARESDLTYRELPMRAATVDEAGHSVEAIMATDAPTTVFDWDRGIIDEVLIAEGGQFAEGLPLLANHSRYSLDDVLGRVRSPRREGNAWVGRAFFTIGDVDAEKVWNKVKQRVLTDVSIGYRATEYTDIPAGQKASVGGKEYQAGAQRGLRITTRWTARELSVVPIGADQNAKIRGAGEPAPLNSPAGTTRKETPMDPLLRKYLEQLGLRADASEAEAKAFQAALGGKHVARCEAIVAKTLTPDAAIDQHRAEVNPAPATTVQASTQQPTTTLRTAGPLDADAARAEGARIERERVAAITALAGREIPDELRTRAISEGWNNERAATEFLNHVRGNRTPAVGNDAPAGIVRDKDRDATREVLGIALAMRGGAAPEAIAKRMKLSDKLENVAGRADRYRGMSMIDLCREAIRLDGRSIDSYMPDEVFRAAVSGGSLTNIFTTSINAYVMVGWDEEGDTTVGWCSESDEADFKTVDAIDVTNSTTMKRLARGKEAEHADISDSKESYRLARYGKQFSIDEQDVIDDRFSVLMEMPQAFGSAARRLRPDLVYSILLSNPVLATTTGALFNSTAVTTNGGHANYAAGASGAGGPLAADSLQAGITSMAKQTKGGVNLNIRPAFLLVPQDLRFDAEVLLKSMQRVIASASGGTYNPLQNIVDLRIDNRLGVAGVTDPSTGTAYAGTAVNWFLTAGPNGRTIKVAYRRGTGRAPMIRSYTLSQGRWGIGWDANMDIAAKALDYRGLYKGKGSV